MPLFMISFIINVFTLEIKQTVNQSKFDTFNTTELISELAAFELNLNQSIPEF